MSVVTPVARMMVQCHDLQVDVHVGGEVQGFVADDQRLRSVGRGLPDADYGAVETEGFVLRDASSLIGMKSGESGEFDCLLTRTARHRFILG